MKTNFLSHTTKTPEIETLPASPVLNEPEREPVQILVIGSPQGVTKIIHTQYRLGFAEISDWSPLQPTQNPGKVMSILVKQIISQ